MSLQHKTRKAPNLAIEMAIHGNIKIIKKYFLFILMFSVFFSCVTANKGIKISNADEEKTLVIKEGSVYV